MQRRGSSASWPGRAGVAPLALVAMLVAPASAAADAAAESRFHDGLARRYVAMGRFAEAIQELFLVQRITPSARNLFNIGICFEQLDEKEEAFLAFSEYLATLAPDDRDEGRREEAERALARIGPSVARLRVTSDPPGATIYVDRVDYGSYGETPRLIAVRPGPHRVVLERRHHRPAELEITAAAGTQVEAQGTLVPILGVLRVGSTPAGTVRVRDVDGALVHDGDAPVDLRLPPGAYTLEVVAPGHLPSRDVVRVEEDAPVERTVVLDPVPRPTGRLTVTSNVDGALVRLDGRPSGFTPIVLPDVEAGPHRLLVHAEGMQPFATELEVGADLGSWATVTLAPEGRPRHQPATWVLGAAGAAGLLAAGVVGGLAIANRADYDDAVEAAAPDVSDIRQRGVALNTSADVLWITGGLALAAAVVLFVLEEKQPDLASSGNVSTDDGEMLRSLGEVRW